MQWGVLTLWLKGFLTGLSGLLKTSFRSTLWKCICKFYSVLPCSFLLSWLFFFSPWTDNTLWSISLPWTNSISLVLVMKDNWKMRGSQISWYHFLSIHQWLLENPARVMTTADVYNLYLFLPWRCLLSWFHVYTERQTLCLMLAWPSQQILPGVIPFAAWLSWVVAS